MSRPRASFKGSPFTKVTAGGAHVIVAHERQEVASAVGALGLNGHSWLVEVPVLLEASRDSEWVIDIASIRLDLVTSVVPYIPDFLDYSDAVIALTDAQDSNPEAFGQLARIVKDYHDGALLNLTGGIASPPDRG